MDTAALGAASQVVDLTVASSMAPCKVTAVLNTPRHVSEGVMDAKHPPLLLCGCPYQPTIGGLSTVHATEAMGRSVLAQVMREDTDVSAR